MPSYAVLLVLAGSLSLLYLKRFRQAMGLDAGEFCLLVNIIVLSGFVGGRFLSLLFHPADFLSISSLGAVAFDSSEGLPTFGVLAGVAAGVWVLSMWLRKDWQVILDYVFLVAPLGHGIARLGCFMAGCCYGRPAPRGLPWAVVFTDSHSEVSRFLLGTPLHPVQLYEAVGDFLIAGLLFWLIRPRVEKESLPRGTIVAGYFAGYGLLRFSDEFFRADATPYFGSGLSVEQALSLGALLAAAVLGLVICRRAA